MNQTRTPERPEAAGSTGMRIDPAGIEGAYRLTVPYHPDARGSFSTLWVRRALEAAGLDSSLAQVNVGRNRDAGTLRGLHFQVAPFSETKIVYVIHGEVFDVIVDLRPSSPTYLTTVNVHLTADVPTALYIPKGLAHGYQTLVPDTTVLYSVSSAYEADAQGGIRWDDESLNIAWPLPPRAISDRDRALPSLVELKRFPGESTDDR
jgi:dTDP-4-dehydrorhamnose 3,5-epimerase